MKPFPRYLLLLLLLLPPIYLTRLHKVQHGASGAKCAFVWRCCGFLEKMNKTIKKSQIFSNFPLLASKGSSLPSFYLFYPTISSSHIQRAREKSPIQKTTDDVRLLSCNNIHPSQLYSVCADPKNR